MEPKGRDESIEIVSYCIKNDNQQRQQYPQGYLEKSRGGLNTIAENRAKGSGLSWKLINSF